MSDWNTDITKAPFRKILEVQNDRMDEPCFAVRGYTVDGMVHENNTLFTSVYTPRKFWSTPSGNMVCPTKWRLKNE